MPKDFRQKSASAHDFAMVPRAEIPRSSFLIEKTLKTAFNGGYLVPMYCKEVLPGDTFNMRATLFCRMATPLFPVMDNAYVETFWFFVPCRLVWNNWQRFMGERDPDPDSSIDYVVPQVTSPVDGYAVSSLQDYLGLPTVGQVGVGGTVTHNTLPLRAYNLIWNEWFRDQNLQDSVVVDKDDGPDTVTDYVLLRRGKRHDYFTSCLPWTQKGDAVTLPLGGSAPVLTSGSVNDINLTPMAFKDTNTGALYTGTGLLGTSAGNTIRHDGALGTNQLPLAPANLYADLSDATAATVNAIRLAFQIQRLLERDARGGTRYTEMVWAHFGVRSPDARLQRPEYLGGGSSPVIINAVANTSGEIDATGANKVGALGGYATSVNNHGFSQSFTEHGYVIGLVNVRADLTYQQGLNRMWSRSTRYDFYMPVFAALGEQAVLNKEIWFSGGSPDDAVFGYQERWAEYRYDPSMVTGLMRSTAATSLDVWHLAQDFSTRPTLDSTFIQDSPPFQRIMAVGVEADGQEFLMDAFFSLRAARPLPMYSVPGLVDHF